MQARTSFAPSLSSAIDSGASYRPIDRAMSISRSSASSRSLPSAIDLAADYRAIDQLASFFGARRSTPPHESVSAPMEYLRPERSLPKPDRRWHAFLAMALRRASVTSHALVPS